MQKIPVGILGATGMVGQQYIRLLEKHPWFEVTHVAASQQSAGKTYAQAVSGRWHMESAVPLSVASLPVHDIFSVSEAQKNCAFVFSAFELPEKNAVRELEERYARAELPVVSNAS